MTQRTVWRFGFTGEAMEQAACVKRAEHEERVAFWTNERDAAEAKLRSHGVEFREHQITGGTRVTAVIDPELNARYAECCEKIDSHRREVEAYSRFARAFALNPSERFELDVDDVAYFGL